MDTLLYLISIFTGSFGAWFIEQFGSKLGLIDLPNERSSHSKPTPKGGGIGILFVFIIISLLTQIPFIFWLPVVLLALVSLMGDKNDFSPILRLFFQLMAAIAICIGAGGFPAYRLEGILLGLFLVLFVVGTANFYNFMDGINGISAITGVIAFGLLACSKYYFDRSETFIMLSICISLACVGFLPFNIPKAKVFIGDVGSILLGFAYASLVIFISESVLDFCCLVSFLFPFYVDALSTMVVRIRNGESLIRPHRSHLYQLLANEKGFPHWKISLAYGLFQLIVGSSVLWVKPYGIFAVLSTLGGYLAAFMFISVMVRRDLFGVPKGVS